MPTTREVFIIAAQRTPIGSFSGSFPGALATLPAPKMAAQVILSLLQGAQGSLPAAAIEQVILGQVLNAGCGQAPARQAVIFADLPKQVQALSVNKVCSSGLVAVMLAANAISLGQADCVLAGGMENMSLAPYLLPKMRQGARLGHAEVVDSVINDALWDVYNNYHMGSAGELCAREHGITREEQDAFAVESYRRAQQAIKEGWFKAEVAKIAVPSRKNPVVVEEDEEPGRFELAKVASLKPVFEPQGSITAANASSLSDGAAVLMLGSGEFVKRHALQPLARIVAPGWFAQEPERFTTAPVGAMNDALKRASLKIAEIDLFEINEAFSVVALACQRQLQIDPQKLNIHGGAVALGHPVGASGARILTTLLFALKRLGLRRGAVAICNGGGEATAMIVESCC